MEVYEANSSQIGYLYLDDIKESIVWIKEQFTQRFITVSVHLASLSQAHLAMKPLLTRSVDIFINLKTCRRTRYSINHASQKHTSILKC